nr:hypothetical protein [Tanacetum cinerariifolium]
MSKNDMENRICTLSKNDLKDLVKTYRIPLDLHPSLLDSGFTMDHLPGNAIGVYTEFLWFFNVPIPFLTFLSFVLTYFKNDVERLCARLIYLREMREEVLVQRVLSHTTAPATKGAMIPLPTPDEIVASLLDPHLAKKSNGPSQVRVCSASDTAPKPSRPSKKRKLRKRASKAGSRAPELGTSVRAASAPTPRLGKRLGAPSVADVGAFGPSHVGTSVHAFTSGRNLSLGGMV